MADINLTKKCSKCFEEKLLSEFHPRPTASDGLRGSCKECRNENIRRYYNTPEGKKVFSECRKRYEKSPLGKKTIRAGQNRYRATEKGRLNWIRARKTQYKLYPEKNAARQAVYKAVNRGKIPHVKTLHCLNCFSQAQEYHHNFGYERKYRLRVVPLCRICHDMVDIRLGVTHVKKPHFAPTPAEM